MTDKTINLHLELDPKSAKTGADKVSSSLKQIQDQANKTRESMAKLTEVGGKLALAGAGILAPFTLAMNKYVSVTKETEPQSKRIVELSKKWEESQVRLGRVTATIVLPALEKGAKILDGIISFAEKNPGVVQAALTIGSTLVILGGLIATTAQLVSTVATIQGLAASAGLAIGGGGAAAGGAAAAGGGLAAAVASGITLVIPAIVGALALAIGAPIGLGIGNALAGTNQTWADIAETGRQLWEITKFFYGSFLPKIIGQGLQSLGTMIGNALKSVADFIGSLFSGGHASGGYSGYKSFGLYGENGNEFTLTSGVTKAWEAAGGKPLNQANMLAWAASQKKLASAYSSSNKNLYSYAQLPQSQIQAMMQAQAAANGWSSSPSGIPKDYYAPRADFSDLKAGSVFPRGIMDTYMKMGSFQDYYTPKADFSDMKAGYFRDFQTGRRGMSQTYNVQVGHGMTIAQTRRVVAANNKAIIGSILSL